MRSLPLWERLTQSMWYASSPCSEKSRPRSITSSGGRSVITVPSARSSTYENANDHTAVSNAAASCFPKYSYPRPNSPMPGSSSTPSKIIPTRPPIPCTPHASSASSQPSLSFSTVHRKQIGVQNNPKTMAAHGLIQPPHG
eukprot:3722136-Rhodomonas_salina.1